MESKKPSKKVLSVLILTAALVAAIIIAFGKEKSSTAINYASNLVAGEKLSIPENPGWQNELSGISSTFGNLGNGEASSTDETRTDAVSRTLMSNYLSLKQNGNLDASSVQELIDKTVDYIQNDGTKTLQITQANLNVVPDNGKQSIADYGENMGVIFRNNKPKTTKNEMVIISTAINSKDALKFDELDSIIATYRSISAALAKMPVPKTFVKAHIDLVRGLSGMAAGLQQVKTVLSDPLAGLTGLKLYQESASLFYGAAKAVGNYIYQNDVDYKQGSGGYYLLYGI